MLTREPFAPPTSNSAVPAHAFHSHTPQLYTTVLQNHHKRLWSVSTSGLNSPESPHLYNFQPLPQPIDCHGNPIPLLNDSFHNQFAVFTHTGRQIQRQKLKWVLLKQVLHPTDISVYSMGTKGTKTEWVLWPLTTAKINKKIYVQKPTSGAMVV